MKILNSLIKSKFFLSLILYYNSFNLQNFDWLQRYRCCFASRLWEECDSTVLYMIQRKFQLIRLVIVKVVTPLNLYEIEPGATFIWKDMQIFRNFQPNPSFFSSNSILNKFMIRACYICLSCDCKCSSNMAWTYFRVLFLACDGRRRGDPNESLYRHIKWFNWRLRFHL